MQVLEETKGSSEAVTRAALAAIKGPTQEASDRLWVYLVFSLSAVLLSAFIAIAIVLRAGGDASLLLTVFSSVLTGLIGLFAPSPLDDGSVT